MTQLNNALTLFFSLLVEAIPFLLIGVVFSSALLLFVDERKLVAMMPKNPLLGALAGSMVGFLFPVCECGNVPVARRLIVQGAPASVAIGFLLAAPTVNPIVFWATWTAFRGQPEIVFLRIGFSLLIATIIGWVFSSQADLRPLLQPAVAQSMPAPQGRRSRRSKFAQSAEPASELLQSGTFLLNSSGQPMRMEAVGAQAALAASSVTTKPLSDRLQLMLDNVVQELRELGGVLILGSAIAAIVQVAIPREVILSLGQGPITSILAMMLLAWVVSICSTVDSFFALSFASTFTSGSLLAFLVFGPMIDVKNIGLLLSVFRGRAIVYLFALAAQLTFLLTLIINLYVS
ncbi:permease [Oculatella sp. FACHB-28]|uniref:permease n=1 Tax=Oculatella sp. FACHB-28 TaxID=2692845 RepID=UPI0016887772|nr:permease [Oculatella sp. FACHB-28]MBD1871520.1 permease [Cyanobacteria bacterium FACHB-471]MBD2057162.1 permease [Oculatella sp. FACHB-28]